MYLENVVFSGFKSYATETIVSFKPGIGVVIGNNGTGKSNILDAIIWVLGENDLERLRCDRTDDLFFSGSRDYPKAEAAKVTLTLKHGKESKAPVTKISRQLVRNGDNAFSIDGVVLPLLGFKREINALGLKDAGKTLIRQEKINEFLYSKPSDRFLHLRELLNNQEVTDDLLGNLRSDFKKFFKVLIPEGDGDIYAAAEDGPDGLTIQASFPGKGPKNSVLLSGGEKTICSLAVNLAIFEQLQSPFYLLDEVEPSLDWTNHHQMGALFKGLAEKRQLIMVTHLHSTMELADTLHGIRVRKDGTSFVKFYFEMNERLLRNYKCF